MWFHDGVCSIDCWFDCFWLHSMASRLHEVCSFRLYTSTPFIFENASGQRVVRTPYPAGVKGASEFFAAVRSQEPLFCQQPSRPLPRQTVHFCDTPPREFELLTASSIRRKFPICVLEDLVFLWPLLSGDRQRARDGRHEGAGCRSFSSTRNSFF